MKKLNAVAAPLRVMELFAGVGGFRLGLQAVRDKLLKPYFDVVWSNQFEPGCKNQHAAHVYKTRWGHTGFVNRDIFEVLDDAEAMADIDALAPEMLVAGFPCQDYSVAKPSNRSEGLQGKKGVLWWSIYRMLSARFQADKPIKYLLLENVDRLVNSPTACRGRDFAIILASLGSLGYAVEWRIVNAADYGFSQRRRRVFIVAYHVSTQAYRDAEKQINAYGAKQWLTDAGTLAQALPVGLKPGTVVTTFPLPVDVLAAQANYRPHKDKTRFRPMGVCIGGEVWAGDTEAARIDDHTRYVGQCQPLTLGDVVDATREIPATYFIGDSSLPQWQYLKGAKSIPRVNAVGEEYHFNEGPVGFPDALDRPSRTIITSEGGTGPSRTKHAICDASGRLRRLVPEELEALNGFPRGFTDVCSMTGVQRAFLMGNALVTGVVRMIGAALIDRHIGAYRPSDASSAQEEPPQSI